MAGNPAHAVEQAIEEITVLGRQDFLETKFTPSRNGSNVDSAKLMAQVPGGAANNNGPLSGQIQYRGMFGPRLNVRVDGMLILGGGPNWMAPPLHHIPAGLMEELVIEQGVSSIASGGGIGGSVTAYWKKPHYSTNGNWQFTGDTEASFSSVDDGNSLSAVLGMSSNDQRLFVIGSRDEGDDYETPGGTTQATGYERGIYGIGYGFQSGEHEFDFDFRRLETDDTGTPSLPMGIDWFYTDIWKASYRTNREAFSFELMVYGSDIDHGMTNSKLRQAPDFSSLPLPPFMGDDKRSVIAKSEELGYKLSWDVSLGSGSLIAGLEGRNSEHHANVSDPDFSPFFVNNFNNSKADSLALFGQWSSLLNENWYLEIGASITRVTADTAAVDAFPARLVDKDPASWPMGTPPRAVWILREAFNRADLSQTDNNVDWVVKARYQATEELVVEAGLAQRTRSPMYQERYLWIPLEANAGLGDGNNYVGDPSLDPEQSLQLELGLDWDHVSYYVSPRVFYRQVDDFIQGVPVTDMAVIGVSANANGDPTPLRFANREAKYWGADLTFGAQLSEKWLLDGIASYVVGEREDTSDNLYRVAPSSLRLELRYEGNGYHVKVQQVLMAKQDDLSATNTLDPLNRNNSFKQTDGYNVTNVYLSWFISSNMTFTAGAENLFDEKYMDHLSGFNRVIGNNVPIGSRLLGAGRNLFGRIQYRW